ncbi:MAG: LPS export ABC transporter ATP-binding protein [Gammaproteobacteria bacterium WSBS_2016_MAG_OTU1]
MNELRATGLVKRYGGRTVLDDVSICVRRGQIVGLLGPNGAGKTTCFYAIAGLIKIDRGSIMMNDEDITKLPMHRRAKHGLSYLPQDSSIFQGLNVMDNVLAILEICKIRGAAATKRASELLEMMGVLHLSTADSKTLSGGERRRVEIARLLATNPSFVLMDEPFAAIAPIAVKELKEIIRHLSALEIGIIVTDHNVREMLALCDHAYILEEGRVLVEGAPDDVAKNETARRAYLGNDFNL